jgi:hypothetical protein
MPNIKTKQKPGANTLPPSYLEGWDQEDWSSKQAQAEKFAKPHQNRKSWVWLVHTYNLSHSEKLKIPGCPWAKKWDTIFKITRAKRAGDMVEAVEHLSDKHEALSSNLSTVRTEKKQMFVRIWKKQSLYTLIVRM